MTNQNPNQEAANSRSRSVFIDETALAIFMNPKHPYYPRARSLILDMDDLDREFVTTNYIVFDVHEWLRNEYGYTHAEYFLEAIDRAVGAGKLTVIPSSSNLELESRHLLTEYPELEYSLREAMTAALMLAYGMRRILTFNPRHQVLSELSREIKIIPSLHAKPMAAGH